MPNAVRKIERLNHERLQEIHNQYFDTKDPRLKETLIENYKCLVDNKYWLFLGKVPGYDADDLKQEGYIQLNRLLDRYDPSSDAQFASYAYRRIMGHFKDLVRRYGARNTCKILKQILDVEEELTQILKRQPTNKEIAQRMSITEEKIAEIKITYQRENNIFYLTQNPDESENILNTLEIKEYEADSIDIEAIKPLFSILDDREKEIIYLFFFADLTLLQISSLFHLSLPRISQLKDKALNSLYCYMVDQIKNEKNSEDYKRFERYVRKGAEIMSNRIEILAGRETLLLLEVSSLLPDNEPQKINITSIAEKYSLLDTEVSSIFTDLCKKGYLVRTQHGYYKIGEQCEFVANLRKKYIIKADGILIEKGKQYNSRSFAGQVILFENHEKRAPKPNNKNNESNKTQMAIQSSQSLLDPKTIEEEIVQAQIAEQIAKKEMDESVNNYIQKEKKYFETVQKLTRLAMFKKIQENLI